MPFDSSILRAEIPSGQIQTLWHQVTVVSGAIKSVDLAWRAVVNCLRRLTPTAKIKGSKFSTYDYFDLIDEHLPFDNRLKVSHDTALSFKLARRPTHPNTTFMIEITMTAGSQSAEPEVARLILKTLEPTTE